MTNPDLGQKRRCLECDAAFYDLKRDPITCPKCGAVHQPVARLKSDGRTPPKGRVFPKRQPALAPAGAAAGAAEGAETIDKDFDSPAEAAEDAETDEEENEDNDGDEAEDESDPTAEDENR